jgi:hypothetical protein
MSSPEMMNPLPQGSVSDSRSRNRVMTELRLFLLVLKLYSRDEQIRFVCVLRFQLRPNWHVGELSGDSDCLQDLAATIINTAGAQIWGPREDGSSPYLVE